MDRQLAACVSFERRGVALAIDLTLSAAVIFALDWAAFSGLGAALVVLGIYRAACHTLFRRTAGKLLAGLLVIDAISDASNPRRWWIRCLKRESFFWGLPSLFLASQAVYLLDPGGVRLGYALILTLSVFSAGLGLIVADATRARTRPDRRAWHDMIASTAVQRGP